MRAFCALLRRDLALGWRQGIDILVVILFFLASGALFPFAFGPEPEILARSAAGIAMAMAALAHLLSLDRLFAADFEDGSLDHLALSALPLEGVAFAKILSQWLLTGLPLLIAAPLLGLLLRLPQSDYPAFLLGIGATGPILTILGCLGAALTLGSRRSGILIAFLILPLFVPALILGMAVIAPPEQGLTSYTAMELLMAIDILALAGGPWIIAVALRQVFR